MLVASFVPAVPTRDGCLPPPWRGKVGVVRTERSIHSAQMAGTPPPPSHNLDVK